MNSASRHLSITIEATAADVYRYASDPRNLPEWAAGLADRTVRRVDGQWIADSPMGTVVVAFAAQNSYGVLDHDVTLPSGETVYNPMRVIPNGAGCEVVFTLRPRPEMSAADFDRDAAAVAADLARLRAITERR
ncbi:MAG TPA: SRPBCC family protein [Jatrophihabitantaceae bacterium]|nr:SRPBCC family protein [Jatrophihabitantaceae bacterium]